LETRTLASIKPTTNMQNQSAGILRINIDVTKIDKSRLFKGKKGTYLDISVLLKNEPDQYDNDGMAVQDLGKEARDRGEKGEILGNAKWAVRPYNQPSQPRAQHNKEDAHVEYVDEDEMPF